MITINQEGLNMHNKVNQKFLLYPLFAVLALYLMSILIDNNIILKITDITAYLIIISIMVINLKRINYVKVYYKFYLTAILIDFISNILYAVPSPFIKNLADIIYLIPNFIYTGLLIFFIFKETRNWNKYQLFSDAVIISVIGIAILWSLFIEENQGKINTSYSTAIMLIYIFLDFCILSICALIILSKGVKNLPKNLIFPLTAMLVYSLSDYFFAYSSISTFMFNRDIGYFLYKISALLFAFGAIYEAEHPYLPLKNQNAKLSENLKTPRKTFVLLGTVVLLFFLEGLITLQILFIIIFSCLFYWGITSTIRFNEVNKMLLKTEKENRQKLEELVEERTRDLTISYNKLEEMSNTDTLTGLHNYKYFSKYIENATANREPFVFLYVDINRFKFINDSYGHGVGDNVLQTIAERLKKLCPKNSELFRIGGDEFVIILNGFKPIEYISAFSENILYTFNEPLIIEPYTLKVNASIGISLSPSDSTDKEELIRYADIAKYTVKNSINRNQYCFFNKSMLDIFNKRQSIELMYKNSNAEQEFILYFQPQFNIYDKKLIGMEALIRWLHPEIGLILPIHFIPVIEDTGEIITLGKLIIRKAFAQIKEWNEKYNLNLRISINVSPKQIEDSNFMNWLKLQMKKYEVKTEWIDLELTESSYMHFNDENKHIFNELFDLGIKTSIDDFGTGYSSLSYIKALNFDRLKIAKELIDNIEDDENSQLIIKAIIMMSDGLKVKTIAEGVEDEKQLNLLNELGCDEIQGYIWGKPVPADEFEEKYIIQNNT